MKLALAAGLFVFLLLAPLMASRRDANNSKSLVVYAVCVVIVIGLGYFGGELVYGTTRTKTASESLSTLADEGAVIFNQSCAMCHYSDQTEAKVGPGLKGLYKKDHMAKSGWKVTDDNIKRQLKTPYANTCRHFQI
jgi:mono/diheme cytochrome c family protein